MSLKKLIDENPVLLFVGILMIGGLIFNSIKNEDTSGQRQYDNVKPKSGQQPIDNILSNSQKKQQQSEGFMTVSQIEKLIESNSPIFLSFWIGMSKDQAYEVVCYLLDKNKISGLVYDPMYKSFTDVSCNELKDFNEGVKRFPYYMYYHFNPNKKTIKARIELMFNEDEINQPLESIVLSIIDFPEDANYRIDSNDFEDILKIYESKYGIREKSDHIYYKVADPKKMQRYKFYEDNKIISVAWGSKSGNSLEAIYIYYEDKIIKQKQAEESLERIKKRIENQEKSKQLNQEKIHKDI